jgi:hypothetical protein
MLSNKVAVLRLILISRVHITDTQHDLARNALSPTLNDSCLPKLGYTAATDCTCALHVVPSCGKVTLLQQTVRVHYTWSLLVVK